MLKTLFTRFIFLLVIGSAASAAAHTYFFGITDLTVNPNSKHFEIIHQYTAHDVENAIAEQKQIHFSPEHAKYDQFIRDYFEQHFVLSRRNKNIPLKWVGLEVKLGKLYIYQESFAENYLLGLVVKNDLLVDTYAKQVNTVNYQDTEIKGSLTFDQSQLIAILQSNN